MNINNTILISFVVITLTNILFKNNLWLKKIKISKLFFFSISSLIVMSTCASIFGGYYWLIVILSVFWGTLLQKRFIYKINDYQKMFN